jgi:hypothetical protein
MNSGFKPNFPAGGAIGLGIGRFMDNFKGDVFINYDLPNSITFQLQPTQTISNNLGLNIRFQISYPAI